jgi:hypothetical protein
MTHRHKDAPVFINRQQGEFILSLSNVSSRNLFCTRPERKQDWGGVFRTPHQR